MIYILARSGPDPTAPGSSSAIRFDRTGEKMLSNADPGGTMKQYKIDRIDRGSRKNYAETANTE